MKRFIVLSAICMMLVPFASFSQSKKEIKSLMENFSNYEVTTVQVAVDGTKFVKVWGYGKKVDIAIMNAKKNAVHACLFRGLPGMESAMATPPIFKSRGAFDDNLDYFMDFFVTGGDYIQYVNVTTDGVPSGQDRREVKGGYKVALYVQVMYDNLKKRMEEDGLVRKLSDGF